MGEEKKTEEKEIVEVAIGYYGRGEDKRKKTFFVGTFVTRQKIRDSTGYHIHKLYRTKDGYRVFTDYHGDEENFSYLSSLLSTESVKDHYSFFTRFL